MKWYTLSGLDDLQQIGQKIFPDIPTLVIQLVCTGVLVFIIAKFLVKPAKAFIKERQDYIANNLKEAEDKNSAANLFVSEAESNLKESRSIGKEIIDAAKITALNEKDRIVEETQQEINEKRKRAKSDIELERKKMKDELQGEIIDVALLAASKIVDREISEEDNKKIVKKFIEGNDA